MNDSARKVVPELGDDDLDAPTLAVEPRAHNRSSTQLDDQGLPSRGCHIEEYEIEGEIARGAMGVVYRARHRELGRLVALKMVLDAGDDSGIQFQRFANEARAAAKLEHPGIVPVFDVGSYRGKPYLTMPYVDGPSLSALLSHGPLPPMRSAEIAQAVARAVEVAHQNGIIHRDLKPANILVDQEGTPRVTDFGVSKSLQSTCELTSSGEVVGTPHYMPPEQAAASHDQVGPASDVYSIGAILYAMLTGRPPFQAATPIEVISQVLTQIPVAPSALNASVPNELEVITLKCLSKSPKERYASSASLADDLGRYLRGEPIEARPPSLWRRLRFMMQRHVMWASVSGSAAFVLVLLTAIMLVNLVRLQSRVLDLEDQLDLAKRQFGSERATVKQFLQEDPDGQVISDALKNWELNRIVAAAETVDSANKPMLAVELAIESARYAMAHELEVPARAIAILQAAVADRPGAAGPSESNEPNLAPEFDLRQLMDTAQSLIQQPMSDLQRELFGLPPREERTAL